MKPGLDAKFDAARDCWLVQVPYGLTKQQMIGIRRWLVEKWSLELRYISKVLEPDKHAFVSQAVQAARSGKIRQVIVSKGEVVLFQSTERMNPQKTYSFGKGEKHG